MPDHDCSAHPTQEFYRHESLSIRLRIVCLSLSKAFAIILAWVAVSGAGARAEPTFAASTAELETVRELDARLAAVMYRLTTTNADKCRQKMPGTGLVLHTLEQYPKATHDAARSVFVFETTLAAAVVVPGSPAEQAGLRPGDSITRINGVPVRAATADEAGTSARRDEIERRLAAPPPEQQIELSIIRDSASLELRVTPRAACRTRHEVRFGTRDLALSDGETIQFSDTFAATADADALAVIAAHELAHTALEHNRKLAAKGISYGPFSGFGRNGKEIRATEDEADRLSVAILTSAGYDPGIAPAFWRGAGRKLGGGILRKGTHAKPAERARLLDVEIGRLAAASRHR